MNLFEIDEDDEKFDLYDREPQRRSLLPFINFYLLHLSFSSRLTFRGVY